MIAEGRDHCIAYLENMFEDSKVRKLVRVQWFYKNNEVLENIPPRNRVMALGEQPVGMLHG